MNHLIFWTNWSLLLTNTVAMSVDLQSIRDGKVCNDFCGGKKGALPICCQLMNNTLDSRDIKISEQK